MEIENRNKQAADIYNQAHQPGALKQTKITQHLKANRPPPREPVKYFGTKNRFCKLRTLGKGTYGEVYECWDQFQQRIVAVKKLLKRRGERGIPATTVREIGILRSLKHTNIVKMLCIDQDRDGIYIVFEMMDIDLAHLIHHKPELFSTRNIKFITFQILMGVNYMHSKRIFHRDLKPANILVDQAGKYIKIADFGLSRTIHQPFRPYSYQILTIWYRSPEMCLEKKCADYSIGVDVWSIGCIMAEMALGTALFKGKENIEMLLQYFFVLGLPNKLEWPEASERVREMNLNAFADSGKGKEIVERVRQTLGCMSFEERFKELLGEQGFDILRLMLALDPMKRVSCKEAMKHPFFDEVREMLV